MRMFFRVGRCPTPPMDRTSFSAALRRTLSAALVALASAAHAGEVTFSPVELARGELVLPDDIMIEDSEAVAIEVVGSTARCEVAASGNLIYSNGPGSCPALWAMLEPKLTTIKVPSEGAKVAVTLKPAVGAGTPALGLSGTAVTIPAALSEMGEFAVLIWDGSPPKPYAWELRSIEDGGLELGPITAAIAKNGRYFAYGYDMASEEGGVLAWPVLATPNPTTSNPTTPTPGQRPPPVTVKTEDDGPSPEPVVMVIDPAPPEGKFSLQAFPPGDPIPPELACPPKQLPQDDMIVVCVDATGPSIRYTQTPRTQHTKPNHPFFVHVVHRIEHRAQIVMGGTVGSYAPGSRGKFVLSQRQPEESFNLEGESPSTPVTYIATARTFAPRRPGFSPMEVRLTDATGALVADPFKLEFWIEETYSGAFRVGVAGILLGALDKNYRAETQPGSLQREIVATGDSVMDLDVVLGYSPYLDDGGRPAAGCESAPFCFNPYFGLGLLSASSNGDLQWLKSVHLGVEWELTEAFAIGLTANLRRVERLADGLRPGYPIEGNVPTDDVFVFGMGIVINLSPEFLKIGAGGAAAVLQ